jgi:hypothetical protein
VRMVSIVRPAVWSSLSGIGLVARGTVPEPAEG